MIKKSKGKYEFIDKSDVNFYKLENLQNYSSKITKIIENIETSEGIIFIYSQFIAAGVLSLALALESNGYSKYDGSLLRDKKTDDDKKYILITGDNELSNKTYLNYLKIENENKNGEKVKVIIGSSTAAEGLDFKYIREVHVLDPWHHFNKIEQVIGRAIRNCSHIDLPFSKRNVLVYLYASTKSKNPKDDNETIDLKMYRIAERKSKQMAHVEYLLKTNAVDCNLNKEGNKFLDEIYKKQYEIETSKNTKHTVSFNDEDNTKVCNYRECDFKCFPDDIDDIESLDSDTYNNTMLVDTYNDLKDFFRNIFRQNQTLSLKNLETLFYSEYHKDYKDILYLSLNKHILSNFKIIDSKNREGVLRQKNGVIMFVPKSLKNQIVTQNNIRTNKRKQLVGLNITSFKNTVRTKKVVKTKKYSDIIDKMESLFNYSKALIDNDKKYTKQDKTELNKKLNTVKSIKYDYLNSEFKENLIREILTKNKTEDLDIIKKNLLYRKTDYDSMADNNDIWGYKTIKNGNLIYYKFTDNNFIEATPDEKKQITKMLLTKVRNDLPSNTIIGFLEEKFPEKTVSLKIRDKRNEGKKGTHIKTGSVCGNDGMKKGKIVDFIQFTLNNNKYKLYEKNKLPGKPNLCNELEIYLREFENENKNQKRWFYTAEETIEYGLNKNN